MSKWTVHVQNFGKIKSASIEVSPFMIFVGNNNSGKSYMMELLWGILNEASNIFRGLNKSSPDYIEFLKKNLASITFNDQFITEFNVSEEIQKSLIAFFNQALVSQKEQLVKKIFNYPVTLEEVHIELTEFQDINIQIEKQAGIIAIDEDDKETEDSLAFISVTFSIADKKIAGFRTPRRNSAQFDLEFLHRLFLRTVLLIIRKDYFRFYSPAPPSFLNEKRQPLYLPASRTGFMHTYRAIIGNQLINSDKHDFEEIEEQEDSYQIAGTNLTLPVILFLEKLQKLTIDTDQQNKYVDEINFLTKEILQGEFRKNNFDQFEFIPSGSEKGVPLHVTSSLVAELAPIVMFLSSSYNPDLWIIEEIESHLHPMMQMQVVRLLFRLLNKGNSVWITTHSDSLAQKVNNLLTLSQQQDKDAILNKLGYTDSDILTDVTKVKAYQFSPVDGKTEVEQLELGPYGFEMPTFNDALETLILETDEIQNPGENR